MTKKGYIRTLEAVVAILIIFLFIYTILPRQQQQEIVQPDEIRLLQQAVLREIESNATFRQYVLSNADGNDDRLDSYAENVLVLVGKYGHNISIQDADNSIVQPASLPSDRNIYADSLVIGSNLNSYNPKIVTFYVWENLS